MNEKSKIYIVIGFILFIVIAVIGYNAYLTNQSKKMYDEFEVSFNSDDKKIFFIGRESCGWCQLFRPIFDHYSEKYNIDYMYVDVEKLTSDDFNSILFSLGIDPSNFGTPLVIFSKAGNVENKINGYVDETELLSILKNEELVPVEEKDIINYIDLKDLKKIIEGKERNVTIVGQTTCTHCIHFKPVLMKIADSYGIKINYINYDLLDDKEGFDSYLSSFSEFDYDWGTPLTIISENGKIIFNYSGEVDMDNYLNLLKVNGIIEVDK